MIREKEQYNRDGFNDAENVLGAKGHAIFLSLLFELNSLVHHHWVGNWHLQVVSNGWLAPLDSTVGTANADPQYLIVRTYQANCTWFLTTPIIQFGAKLFLGLDNDIGVAVIKGVQRGSLIEKPPLAHVLPFIPWTLAAVRFPKTPRQTPEYSGTALLWRRPVTQKEDFKFLAGIARDSRRSCCVLC